MERRVWLARLPEMRLAYLEIDGAYERLPSGFLRPDWEVIGALWDAFNDWRVRVRPALGRIDVAALGITDEQRLSLRVAVPIRSDYRPPEPARTMLFPGGSYAYCYADNVDEIDEATATAARWIEEQGLRRVSAAVEAYKFHYNNEQHPCDCGYLVVNADGSDPLPPASSHASPLPIAR
jgi:hypothetical protein